MYSRKEEAEPTNGSFKQRLATRGPRNDMEEPGEERVSESVHLVAEGRKKHLSEKRMAQQALEIEYYQNRHTKWKGRTRSLQEALHEHKGALENAADQMDEFIALYEEGEREREQAKRVLASQNRKRIGGLLW